MKYVEIHNQKEYEKKKEWLKAIDLLQDEIAYNLVVVHNMYSDVKYNENSDREIVYIHRFYGHDSNKKIIEKMKKIYKFSLEFGLWRIEYERCLENEEGLYDEKDQIFCLENTVKLKKLLIGILRSIK